MYGFRIDKSARRLRDAVVRLFPDDLFICFSIPVLSRQCDLCFSIDLDRVRFLSGGMRAKLNSRTGDKLRRKFLY